MLQDRVAERLVAADHEAALVQRHLGREPPARDLREHEAATLDEGIRLAVLIRQLPGPEAPAPAPSPGALEVHTDAPSPSVDARASERPGEHPDRQIVGEVDRPVLEPDPQPGASSDVVAVKPPLDHPRLDQVGDPDLARHPVHTTSAPLLLGEVGGSLEQQIGGPAPVGQDVSIGEARPSVHDDRVVGVDRERLAAEALAILLELLRPLAGEKLGGGVFVRR